MLMESRFQQAAAQEEVDEVVEKELAPIDETEEDLKPYLLTISLVPTQEEIIEIANDTEKFEAM